MTAMHYDQLFLEPLTKRFLDAYLTNPSHALLLSGKAGSGLGTLAKAMARQLVAHDTDVEIVCPDERGTIGIETVRSLYVDTRGARESNQVILIDNIDSMSFEAQHAFLKLLEEPNQHTLFILTAHSPELLLETIRSRAQAITIQPISKKSSKSVLIQSGIENASKQHQLLFVASGRPAELRRLADEEDYFNETSKLVRDARALLSSPAHEKLVGISAYTDRDKAIRLVQMLARILAFSLERQFSHSQKNAVRATELCLDRLQHNGHVKTQLTNLALQLS